MVEVVVNNWLLRGDFNVVEHIPNVGLEGYNGFEEKGSNTWHPFTWFFSDVRIGLFL
jgi:hypothetical protein